MHTRPSEIADWLRERADVRGRARLRGRAERRPRFGGRRRLCQHRRRPTTSSACILPCHSEPHDEADARLAADHFSMPVIRIDLAEPTTGSPVISTRRWPVCRRTTSAPPRPDDRRADDAVPLANVKPRLRMTGALLHRQLAELSRRRHGQPQRADDRLLHQARRRRRRPAAARRPAEERGAGAGARARSARGDRRPSRPAPACGSGRPTKRRWGSPTASSNAISRMARRAWRPPSRCASSAS